MKFFQKSIERELLKNFSGATVILFTIVMTIMLIRILGMTSKGQANPSELVLLLGLNGIGNAAPILTLSLLMSIVYTFSRMYLDSEMVIWFSSGVSLSQFLKPVWRFCWPVLMAIALLLFFAWPWSNVQTQFLKERFEKRSDIERVTPGKFQESASSKMVFFIDKLKKNSGESTNVFVSKHDGNIETITTAKTGQIEFIDGIKFLSLAQGHQTSLDRENGAIRTISFESFKFKIENEDQYFFPEMHSQMLSTLDLIKNRSSINLGELYWRLSLFIAAVVLCLLGIQLASVNPRVGRSYSLAIAIFSFIIYFNTITVVKRLIASQSVGFYEMMISVHGTTLLILVLWFLHTEFNLHWRRFLPSPK